MKVSGKHFTLVISILLMIIFSSACGPRQASLVLQPEPSLTPTEPPLPTASATLAPTATATPEPIYLRVDADLPAAFEQSLKLEGTDFQRVSSGKTSAVLDYGRGNPVSTWIYALAAPFPTVTNTIPAKNFLGFWQRAEAAPFTRLILDAETLKALQSRLGAPVGDVEVLDADSLLPEAWTTENTWAVIPFEQIQPRWKIIALDGQSPLHKDFAQSLYPLAVTISLTASQGFQSKALTKSLQPYMPQSNRDPEKLVTVILTGVTAMVRGTASEMEDKGITRGADVIGPVTREADILHISNEVPFAVDCKDPVPKLSGKLSFCSKDSYLELLEAVGTDVVELTGDHFQDWGEAALEHTLELYRQNGLPYYGGGLNIEEAKQPVKLEIKGTKIAFLGCNAKPTIYGNATAEKGGNFRCDWEYMTAEVKSLRAEGYLPIVTFQHLEFYQWTAQSQLVADFHKMADAGAVIVSGSQSHQPHGMEITDTAVLHYGLGNLFFDQYGLALYTNYGFLDRHVFYDGKYLGVEPLPIQFKDYSQPVWPEEATRSWLMEVFFSVSEWNYPPTR
ncbi:MAG: CapA family protein [Chloroflexi bacterium]|nr:CapA family protein [Chloroflexota bacterium]